MENDFTKPAQDLGKTAAEYVDLKIDELKLRTAKGLSVASQKLIVAILLITLAGIVLTAAAFGGVLLIGKLINDYAAGAFIVAGFFLIVLIVLFLLRNKLFMGGLVNMFVRLFFEEK
ncbi:MAG: hypothetical protein ACI3ZQ_11720 [Candidatus Cryptobacteroides sp.]